MNNKVKDSGHGHPHCAKKESKRKSKKKVTNSDKHDGGKRKLKTQSLIVPTIVSDSVDVGHTDEDLGRCPSPNGGGNSFSQRLSLRSFRRFRSLSKSRDSSSSSSSGDGGATEQHSRSTDAQSLCPDSMIKSSSLIDLKSLCSKLHRHFTSTGSLREGHTGRTKVISAYHLEKYTKFCAFNCGYVCSHIGACSMYVVCT